MILGHVIQINNLKKQGMKARHLFPLMIIICCLVLPMIGFAQGPPDPCDQPGATCPIDGGLSFLIAAGVGYGVKKYRQAKKAKSEEEMAVGS